MASETVHLSLEFPKLFVDGLGQDRARVIQVIKEAAIMDFYRQRKLSLRKAAELLGCSYRDFLALTAQHKISPFEYEEGWMERELAELSTLKAKSV